MDEKTAISGQNIASNHILKPDNRLTRHLVNRLRRDDGNPMLRPVHARGIGASGYFTPSPVARDFCVAVHFSDATKSTPVKVRFSNGSGAEALHDGWSDVRGMATRFVLDETNKTDLIAMTLPCFFTPTSKAFLRFAKAATPATYERENPWRKILDMLQLTLPMRNPYKHELKSPDVGAIRFADTHPRALPAVFGAANIGAPESYVRAAYHAVHTFVVTDPHGTRRWVRFGWQPILGVLNTDPREEPRDNYLGEDLRKRLAAGPARFSLMMMIGETGDNFDDPSRQWPPHRRRIMMGTLTLEKVAENQETDSEWMSFNPMNLTAGIDASGDEVLYRREAAYKLSSNERMKLNGCPFGGDSAHGA